MTKPLSDRIALVTGASRGIGAAIALELSQAGAHVVAVARTVGGLEALDDKIKSAGGSATLVPLDVKDKEGRTPMTWAEGVFLATNPARPKPSSIALLTKLLAAKGVAE